MKELFSTNNYFNYSKPVELIKKLISLVKMENNDIILDFFSGSATTAHAVMQLNAEDGGNRQFIMVQLPELLDEKSEAYKADYKNICEIGKARIRRAGEKVKKDIYHDKPLPDMITAEELEKGKIRIAKGYGNATTGNPNLTPKNAASADESFIDLKT